MTRVLPERTALYRLYDASDELLYVGITCRPKNRWRQHAADKPWWAAVTRKDLVWLGDREEAELAERLAIKNEAPRFNAALLPGEWFPHAQAIRRARKPLVEYESPWYERPIYIKHRHTGRPLPALIMDALKEDVLAGRLIGGDRLPTLYELQARFGTSVPPIRKAITWLEEDGYLVRREGARRVYVSTLALLPPKRSVTEEPAA